MPFDTPSLPGGDGAGLPLDPDALQPGTFIPLPHLTPALQAVVFAGGCLGTLARYSLVLALPVSGGWPFATFIANLLGAFVLGALLEGLMRYGNDEGMARLVRLGLGTGFIGAFTTYSSFAVETILFIQGHHPSLAIAYAAASIVGGTVMSTLGIHVAGRRHVLTGKPS